MLLAINRDDLRAARQQLESSDIGPDFRRLIESRLQKPAVREGVLKYISVGVPLQTWDEYAKEARLTGRRPSECLAAAIERDRCARVEASDTRAALERTSREFIAAAHELLHELRTRVCESHTTGRSSVTSAAHDGGK